MATDFSIYTYDYLLQQMLATIPDDIDKRQGSIAYAAVSAVAAARAQDFIELQTLYDRQRILTATGTDLDDKGLEVPCTRVLAVKAKRAYTAIGATVPTGSRFSCGDTFWTVLDNSYVLCEEAGLIGNSPNVNDMMINIGDDIPGLQSIKIGAISIPGSEQESDDSYRSRCIELMNEQPNSTNKAQVLLWCKSVQGIGGAKVFPLWNGANTVKAVLINTLKLPASPELVTAVQTLIDPPDSQSRQGLGNGLADIGCVFTAASATSLPINVSVKVTQLAPGYTIDDAKNQIQSGLESYLNNIAFVEDQFKYNQVGAMIFDTAAVVDYSNLTINNGVANITIPPESVCTLGILTVTL